MICEQLREAGFSAVNEASIKEWLTVDSNEPGHTALTEEEIIETVTRLEHEDNEDIINEIAVPSHSQAFTSLSTSLWWLEAQPDCDSAALQILCPLQQNAASKRASRLMQRRITSFFVD